jgi:hypothetical protein
MPRKRPLILLLVLMSGCSGQNTLPEQSRVGTFEVVPGESDNPSRFHAGPISEQQGEVQVMPKKSSGGGYQVCGHFPMAFFSKPELEFPGNTGNITDLHVDNRGFTATIEGKMGDDVIQWRAKGPILLY